MKKYNLFLDDFRVPKDAFNYTHDTDFLKLEWVIVRSYREFVEEITKRYNFDSSFPGMIAFDHDLDDAHYSHTAGNIPYESMKEKTGYHCASWLVDFCMDRSLHLPSYKVHSMNPAGKANIQGLLSNFQKHFALPEVDQADRVEKLEALADILSRVFHYGSFKAETVNERVVEGLLKDLGYWETDEKKILLRPSYDKFYRTYKRKENEQA